MPQNEALPAVSNTVMMPLRETSLGLFTLLLRREELLLVLVVELTLQLARRVREAG